MKATVHKQTHLYNRFALDVGHPVAALHRQSLLPACGICYDRCRHIDNSFGCTAQESCGLSYSGPEKKNYRKHASASSIGVLNKQYLQTQTMT